MCTTSLLIGLQNEQRPQLNITYNIAVYARRLISFFSSLLFFSPLNCVYNIDTNQLSSWYSATSCTKLPIVTNTNHTETPKPPKKKANSLDDKKTKLLNFFMEDFAFYSIKEIESIASKKTGISSMQIKDILQLLIDDDLIKYDKCGSMNLYWCFQYELTKGLIVNYSKYSQLMDTAVSEKQKLLDVINQAKASRTDQVEGSSSKQTRKQLLEEIAALNSTKQQLAMVISSLKQNDPARLEEMDGELQRYKEQAELYADNVEAMVGYLARQHGLPSGQLKQELGIPEYYEDL